MGTVTIIRVPSGPPVTIRSGGRGPQGKDGTGSGEGTPGPPGPSAYEVAVANGFEGDEAAWLASLKGEKGDPGEQGPQGAQGPAGVDGDDGLSAYEVAVANGFEGDEAAWLASLKGEQGPPGPREIGLLVEVLDGTLAAEDACRWRPCAVAGTLAGGVSGTDASSGAAVVERRRSSDVTTIATLDLSAPGAVTIETGEEAVQVGDEHRIRITTGGSGTYAGAVLEVGP